MALPPTSVYHLHRFTTYIVHHSMINHHSTVGGITDMRCLHAPQPPAMSSLMIQPATTYNNCSAYTIGMLSVQQCLCSRLPCMQHGGCHIQVTYLPYMRPSCMTAEVMSALATVVRVHQDVLCSNACTKHVLQTGFTHSSRSNHHPPRATINSSLMYTNLMLKSAYLAFQSISTMHLLFGTEVQACDNAVKNV